MIVLLLCLPVMIMSILTSNYQGAGSPTFITAFRLILERHHSDLLVLLEPRISSKKADNFVKKLRCARSHRIEANGFSGEFDSYGIQIAHHLFHILQESFRLLFSLWFEMICQG